MNEKAYRVLDPETKTWTTQAEKPSEEQILAIKAKVAENADPNTEEVPVKENE